MMNIAKSKLEMVQDFLLKNAQQIQKLATEEHKRHLGGDLFRTELIQKYKNLHIKLVEELAHNIERKNLERGSKIFRGLAEVLAKEAVKDGLSIEETVDGTIFLKQAILKKAEELNMLKFLTIEEYHEFNLVLGTYGDIIASKVAFTYHDERQQIENNLKYLAESSKILASSLDYKTTLDSIAKLAVPKIADWCSINILTDENKIEQVTVAHIDPKKIAWAKKLRKYNPVSMEDNHGIPGIIKSGKAELYTDITDEMLVAAAKNNKAHLKLLRSLDFSSAMSVPICVQKKCIGVISFVATDTKRHYNQSDLAIAQELANRAGIAIENARLYKGSIEAISLRDEFISVASHELKTPVTSVKMFAQVLKNHSEQIGDSKAVQYLGTMDKQLNKLTELIYNLLNVSKIQAGRMEYSEKLFDFDEAVKEITSVLQQTSAKHKIILEGKTNKKILGDEERIGQVLNNLVSNAIKYSPKANKIVIKLASEKGNIHVAVQDFGIGIAEPHLKRIFDRFYRVYDSKDKTFPGLGIGLYISSEIIKRYGGKFWVQSDPGKGSTFHFSLPVSKIAQKKLTRKK